MGLSKSKQVEIAKEYAKSHTEDLFKSMCEPRYRGPNFNWDIFPNMAGSMARVSCYNAFPHRVGKDIEDLIYQESHQRARVLVLELLKERNEST